MPITNSGVNLITQRLFKNFTDSGYQPFDTTNATIGVGDSTTAFDKTHTSLQGTNKLFKGMDSGFPKVDATATPLFNTTYQSTFGANEANWNWREWCIVNHVTPASGKMLNRVVESNGTKVQGQVWTMTVVIEINPA